VRWVKWPVAAVACGAIAAASWTASLPGRPETTASPAPSPTVPEIPAATPSPLDGVPEGMIGRWRGNADGPGGVYELELELTRGNKGQSVGVSGVGSATCRFSVILEGTEPDAILFSEKLTSGSGCLGSSGRLALRGQGLRYSALTEEGDVVVGELHRV
jgi:hypothetical protein